MLNIKGFGVINALADNTPNVVSLLGELSADAMTSSREENKAVFVNNTLGEVNFQSFTCRTVDGTQVAVPLAYQTSILTITNWLYNKAKVGEVPATSLAVSQLITDEFGSDIANVTVGDIITKGIVRLPSSLSWSIIAQDAGNLVQVWFSDSHFQNEFDGGQIVVIPPLSNIDSLFETSSVVQQLLAERTFDVLTEEITVARGVSPYTILRSYSHNRVSIIAPTSLPTTWTALIYGRANDNIDAINNAFIEYVLANSNYPLSDWKLLIPSLFVNTEFLAVPYWDKTSIENQTLAASLYSPIVNPTDIVEYALLAAGGVDEQWVTDHVNHVQTTHKSLAFTAFGGQENIDNIYTVLGKYPDYIAVATTSPDFSRMSAPTREWSQAIHDLVKAAETMTPFSPLPDAIGRTTREGKLYATKRVGNAQWLVYAKQNMSI